MDTKETLIERIIKEQDTLSVYLFNSFNKATRNI